VTFEAGDPVRIEMTKWGERPHWQIPGVWLGSDEQGDWIGIPSSTSMSRPGLHVVSQNDQVGLVPPADADERDRGWVATFHGPGGTLPITVYVDITTPPVWHGSTLRTVDLDLDVVRNDDGAVWVDDEDEFAEHQVALGYPGEIVSGAERSCALVRATMEAGRPPYDGSHEPWLAALGRLSARS